MQRATKVVGFGFLAWLIPFAISVTLFPLKASAPGLFESCMAVVLAATTIGLLNAYACSRRISVPEATMLGIAWLAANWICDLPIFLFGPMQRTLASYAMDIGVTYAMIPVITIGAACLVRMRCA
jgi:hypothetical protein